MASLQNATVRQFGATFDGTVFVPGEEGYDDARKIWNAMIDKRPAVIARCGSTADVVRALTFARENELAIAIRGGGHNIAGHALIDDGLVIDLSAMKAVEVDPAARRVKVEGGATLADVDAATQRHALATPLGINSTTGVAGLALGGGFGWLSRKWGLTSDNLECAEVVTASAEFLTASLTENPDLFWALRGGGGNFGVVTRFEFRAHPLGPDVLSGLIVYSLDDARSVMRQYREFMAGAPDELCVWAVFRAAPPLPFIPAERHGEPIVAMLVCYAGQPQEGARLIEPLRKFGKPVGEHLGAQPFTAWQKTFDPMLTPGARNYWKTHNFSRLDDGVIDVFVEQARKLPTKHCEIFLGALGGATKIVAPDATAYAHRDAIYVMNVHGRWDQKQDDDRCIRWARETFDAAAPFASGGAYINFMTADETMRVKAAYGTNYDRLAQVKRKYDPGNLFRINQNIKPASASVEPGVVRAAIAPSAGGEQSGIEAEAGGSGSLMEGTMTRDPVCGMDVDERDAKAKGLTAEFGGQVRFFCSEQCRDMFKKDPTRRWQAQQAEGQPGQQRPGQQA